MIVAQTLRREPARYEARCLRTSLVRSASRRCGVVEQVRLAEEEPKQPGVEVGGVEELERCAALVRRPMSDVSGRVSGGEIDAYISVMERALRTGV